MIRAPRPIEVVFQFKQDTLVLYEAASREVLETMAYTEKDGRYTSKKVRGNSPCDDTTVGNYSYRIDKDVITITPVLDACMARAMAFIGALKKTSWPAK